MGNAPISFEDKMLLWLERVTDQNKAQAARHLESANARTAAAVATPNRSGVEQAEELADVTAQNEDDLRKAKTLLDGNGLLARAIDTLLRKSNENIEAIWRA